MATDRDSPPTEADPAGADEAPANPIRAAVAAAERFVPPEDDGAAGDFPGSDDGPPPHDGPPEGEAEAEGGKRRRRTPQRDQVLAELSGSEMELWHDPQREGFASIPVGGHVEHWPLRSAQFRRWLGYNHYLKHNSVLGSQAMEDVIRIFDALATSEGRMHETHLRIGRDGDDIYYDPCNEDWSAWRITGSGWEEMARPPLKMLRSPSMLPTPAPVGGDTNALAALRPFIPARDEADFILAAAWILAAFWSGRPFPILAVSGEQGSGKSLFSRMMRSIIDPSIASTRALPKDERDLVVAAYNSHCLVFDNVSSMASWQSDALCRVATGSGFGTRKLHTDRDENIVEVRRPVLLNGIPDLFGKPDLADRSLSIHLPAISEGDRKTERQLLKDFEEARPRILAGLFDCLSVAIRRLPSITLAGAPRMADFCELIVAAAPAMDITPEDFLSAYEKNRSGVAEISFENDPFGMAIYEYVTTMHPSGLEMAPAALFSALNAWAAEDVRRGQFWPKSAAAFGTRLRRLSPVLRSRGLDVETLHSGVRRVRITPRREG